MLSLQIPAVMQMVGKLTIGLAAFEVENDPLPKLIVKSSKETILAARMNQGFAIYLIPYQLAKRPATLGFLAAFFDDEDEPIVAGGAFIEEFNAEGLRRLMLSAEADIHFFDELNREMLGYRATLSITERYCEALSTAVFPHFEGLPQGKVLEQLSQWFVNRGVHDDAEAIRVTFKEPLFPEDYVLLDLSAGSRSYHGASRPRHNLLVRPEPGQFQERDIVEMLQRIFPSEGIYWSPLRTYDREEIADVIVVTDQFVLVIQAKDSPNTEAILRNTLDRKRATAVSSIQKAVRQIRGSVSYLRRASPMPVIIDGREQTIEWSEKALCALIVVKEMFDSDFDQYTPPMLKLADEIGVLCIALSFNELHEFTKRLGDEQGFFEAYWRIMKHGQETGMFPRLRIAPEDAE